MGFWNVTPDRLRVGDEIRVTTMGGQEFLTVREIDRDHPQGVRVKLAWGLHVPVEPFWDVLGHSEKLTVRR
jgi:hypothetical protein